jgi:hypothetical protein
MGLSSTSTISVPAGPFGVSLAREALPLAPLWEIADRGAASHLGGEFHQSAELRDDAVGRRQAESGACPWAWW